MFFPSAFASLLILFAETAGAHINNIWTKNTKLGLYQLSIKHTIQHTYSHFVTLGFQFNRVYIPFSWNSLLYTIRHYVALPLLLLLLLFLLLSLLLPYFLRLLLLFLFVVFPIIIYVFGYKYTEREWREVRRTISTMGWKCFMLSVAYVVE